MPSSPPCRSPRRVGITHFGCVAISPAWYTRIATITVERHHRLACAQHEDPRRPRPQSNAAYVRHGRFTWSPATTGSPSWTQRRTHGHLLRQRRHGLGAIRACHERPACPGDMSILGFETYPMPPAPAPHDGAPAGVRDGPSAIQLLPRHGRRGDAAGHPPVPDGARDTRLLCFTGLDAHAMGHATTL